MKAQKLYSKKVYWTARYACVTVSNNLTGSNIKRGTQGLIGVKALTLFT